jgi:hypothetical protein
VRSRSSPTLIHSDEHPADNLAPIFGCRRLLPHRCLPSNPHRRWRRLDDPSPNLEHRYASHLPLHFSSNFQRWLNQTLLALFPIARDIRVPQLRVWQVLQVPKRRCLRQQRSGDERPARRLAILPYLEPTGDGRLGLCLEGLCQQEQRRAPQQPG